MADRWKLEVNLRDPEGTVISMVPEPGSGGVDIELRRVGKDRKKAKNKKLSYDEAINRALQHAETVLAAANEPLDA